MIPYQTHQSLLPGSNFLEVKRQGMLLFDKIAKKTKRRPYLRSDFFAKEKIFFDFLWTHLYQKRWAERTARLKFFACAIELIQKSRHQPSIKFNPNIKHELLYRFAGLAKNGALFYVQIKENKKNGRKYLMSIFPPE